MAATDINNQTNDMNDSEIQRLAHDMMQRDDLGDRKQRHNPSEFKIDSFGGNDAAGFHLMMNKPPKNPVMTTNNTTSNGFSSNQQNYIFGSDSSIMINHPARSTDVHM